MENAYFERWLEASGATEKEAEEARARFRQLLGQLKGFPEELQIGDAATTCADMAVEQTRDNLHKYLGFEYRPKVFEAQEVLRTKKANCLGFPMLIASIAAEHGHAPQFRTAIISSDGTAMDEAKEFRTFGQDSLLAKTAEPSKRIFKFSTLEHCLLDADGTIVEATSPTFYGNLTEGAEVISEPFGLDKQTGLIYRDRASDALFKGEAEKSRKLLGRAIALAGDYREVFSVLRQLATSTFDDKARALAVKRHKEIGGKDSLFHFEDYLGTGNLASLEKALKVNPRFAYAIAAKAAGTEKSSPDEARALFSRASKCYAASASLDLPKFYTAHTAPLARLFGKEDVEGTMRNFADECDGDFFYYDSMYQLTKSDRFLKAMRDCRKTPLQEVTFLERARGTKYFDARRAKELGNAHGDSQIYQMLRQELNSSSAL